MKHFKSTKKTNNLIGIQVLLQDYNAYKVLLNQEIQRIIINQEFQTLRVILNKYLIVVIKFINLLVKYLQVMIKLKRKNLKLMKMINLKAMNKVY